MKKHFLLLFLCAIIMAVSLGCDLQKQSEIEVNFYIDGEFYYSVKTDGDSIEMPKKPKKADYAFVGWFADDGVWNTPFSYDDVFDASNRKNLNFYAKWRLAIDDQTIGDTSIDRQIYTDSRSYNEVLEVSDGYIAVGELYYTPLDAVIAKYDKQDNLVWEKAFGGSGWDRFNSIIEVTDGYIVHAICASDDGHLSGLKKDSRGQGTSVTVKYDTNGNLVWAKELGVSAYVANDEGFFAVGGLKSLSDDNMFVAQFSADGNLAWKKSIADDIRLYEGGDPYWWQSISISNVFSTPDGYLLFGQSMYSYSFAMSYGPIFMLSLDKYGGVLWQREFAMNLIEAIDVSNDGINVAGRIQKYDGEFIIGSFPIGTVLSSSVQKYDFEMNLIWEIPYDREGYITFTDAKEINGNIFITGFNSGGFIIGVDNNGQLFWEKTEGESYNNIFSLEDVIGVYRGAKAHGTYFFEFYDMNSLILNQD